VVEGQDGFTARGTRGIFNANRGKKRGKQGLGRSLKKKKKPTNAQLIEKSGSNTEKEGGNGGVEYEQAPGRAQGCKNDQMGRGKKRKNELGGGQEKEGGERRCAQNGLVWGAYQTSKPLYQGLGGIVEGLRRIIGKSIVFFLFCYFFGSGAKVGKNPKGDR